MGQRTEHLKRLRRASVEALWTGRAAALAGAAVAILSAAGTVPLVPVAGLVFAAAGVLMGIVARQRILELDRELRNATVARRPGPSAILPVPETVAAGAESLASSGPGAAGAGFGPPSRGEDVTATLWELEHEFDVRRALRLVGDGTSDDRDLDGTPDDGVRREGAADDGGAHDGGEGGPAGDGGEDALIAESALLPVTLFDLGSHRSWDRLVLSVPGTLFFLREEDLDHSDRPVRPPLVVVDEECESCVFWLPGGYGRGNPAWKVAYARSPDGDPYLNLHVAHRGTVRVRFRIANCPPGPIREGLWAQFELLAHRVADAVEGRR